MPRDSRYALRLPPELYELIKTKAAEADRSMNEEILQALTSFYNVESEQNRRIAELERRLQLLSPQTSQPVSNQP